MYHIDVTISNPYQEAIQSRAFLLDFNPCNVNLWHKRLGHPNYLVLSHVFKTLNLSSSLVKDVNFCDFGRYGKHCQFMFPNSLNKAKFPL